MVKYIGLVFFVFVVVGVLIYFGFFQGRGGVDSNGFESFGDGGVGSGEGTEEKLIGAAGDEGGLGSGSGGSGSGSSGGGAGGGDTGGSGVTCTEQQISYVLKNFVKNGFCNSFVDGACVNKRIDCSLEAHNLDGEIGGTFNLKFTFFGEAGNEFGFVMKDIYLEPGANGGVNAIFDIQGESANKGVDCVYSVEGIPTKTVCT